MNNSTTQPRKPLTAVILPSYNEGKNLSPVLDVVHRSRILDEIILVDDGSTDNSVDLLEQFTQRDARARLLHHEINRGKGQAIFTGWAATSAPYLLLLDTDLKDLHPVHIDALLTPVLTCQTDMTLGLFVGGRLPTDISHWVTPFLTGQRGLRAEILQHVTPEAAAGYGFEIALTLAARRNGFNTRIVPMKGVWHPPSEIHRGFCAGMTNRMQMYDQIFRAWQVSSADRFPRWREFLASIEKPQM